MINKKSISKIFKETTDMNWRFEGSFSKCFLDPKEVSRLLDNISFLRKHKEITIEERMIFLSIINLGRNRYKEFRTYVTSEPRKIAQKFIGKKNVRNFIFKRDDYRCLKCGKDYSLSIDHIVPINKNGDNRLFNLQTLCSSCNSSKSDKIIDYRKGGSYGTR